MRVPLGLLLYIGVQQNSKEHKNPKGVCHFGTPSFLFFKSPALIEKHGSGGAFCLSFARISFFVFS